MDLALPACDQSSAEHPRSQFITALVTVCLLHGLIGLTLSAWEATTPTAAHHDAGHYHGQAPDTTWFGQLFCKWDSYWYLQIAANGYTLATPAHGQANVAFAPLYPATIAGLTTLGIPSPIAGVFISLICFVLMLQQVYAWGVATRGPPFGAALVLTVGLLPATWVFHMIYSEAMFCLAVAGFLNAWAQQRPRSAALWAVMLPLTRFAGLAMIGAILLEGGRRVCRGGSVRDLRAPLLGAVGGAALLMLTYAIAVGEPLAFIKAKHAWAQFHGLYDRMPSLVFAFGDRLRDDPLTLLYLAIFGTYATATVVLCIRRPGIPAWFSLGCMGLYLFAPDPSGTPRFLLPLFPLHALLLESVWLHPKRRLAVVITALALAVLVARSQLTWRAII
jgi:hypothetical protein